ncbi:phage/plasmid primase, P4 family [Enterococcus cecorum]|uniref:phage/plasmid primase, P4 family n=1 Tax=Enterococcus cecorum TaxID=44008 RepID=UPI00148C7106|nr:phage/plasmid primase, P4 family [Enterococcus cecorum]
MGQPHLVPCKNGIYNTKTKTLEAFSPNYVFLSKLATDYNPTIEMPVYPNYSRKKAIWLYGSGSNGKSTYQDVIKNIVGNDCYSTLKFNEFPERFSLHSLIGKSVNIGDDVNAGVRVDDSSNFNSIVTHDSVTIEEKYKSPYHTTLYCTLVQSTNEMPTIRNKTNGTYRRMLIVPFENQFEDTPENWEIKENYIKSKEVLEWILAKALSMDFEQFINPNASKALLEEYKADNDAILAFKQDVFDVFVENGVQTIPVATLYEVYKAWCKRNNITAIRDRKFNKELSEVLGKKWKRDSKHFAKSQQSLFCEVLNELRLNKEVEVEANCSTQRAWYV